jgi:hypothetical protein
MIGYLVCLAHRWQGIKHLLFVTRDELEMLEQFHQGKWCQIDDNETASRVVWCATTPHDWEEWDRKTLAELCCQCDHGGRAA